MRKIFFFTFLIIGLSCSTNENNTPNGNEDDDINAVDSGNNSNCNSPDGLFVDNITTVSVRTNWGDPNGSQLFNVEYGSRGFTIENGTRVSSSTPFKEITGLVSSTEYDFYVRSNCGGTVYSNWSGPHSFATN